MRVPGLDWSRRNVFLLGQVVADSVHKRSRQLTEQFTGCTGFYQAVYPSNLATRHGQLLAVAAPPSMLRPSLVRRATRVALCSFHQLQLTRSRGTRGYRIAPTSEFTDTADPATRHSAHWNGLILLDKYAFLVILPSTQQAAACIPHPECPDSRR